MNRTYAYQQLPIVSQMPGGFCWYLADERWQDWARRANQEMVCGGEDQQGVEILKKGTRRLIFRLKGTEPNAAEQSVVVKSHRLSGLRKPLLRYRRYGPSEVRNLFEAAKRGLPVPKVFGYGELRRWWLVVDMMIMMEDLAPRRTAATWLRETKNQTQRQVEILDRILELFVRLYRAGCNHIDVNDKSIWLSDDPADVGKISDFQYTRFLDQPSAKVLMLQAAYFSPDIA